MSYAAVLVGGALGSLARWSLMLWLPPASGGFPLATFAANVTGAFGLVVVGVLLTERWLASPLLRPLLGAGFFGAYTTFSIMALEGVLLIEAGRYLMALTYWLLTLLVGQSAGLVGLVAVRSYLRAGVQ